MKKKLAIYTLLLIWAIYYCFQLTSKVNLYLKNTQEVYLDKFKPIEIGVIYGYIPIDDLEFKKFLLDASKISSAQQFVEYRKKLTVYLKAKKYNSIYLQSIAFSPFYAEPIKDFQRNFKKEILQNIKGDFEKSLLIKNFVPWECQNDTLEDAWKFLDLNTNSFLSYPILSSIKECFFMGKIKKEEFLLRGIDLLEKKPIPNIFVKSFAENLAEESSINKQIIRWLLQRTSFVEKLEKTEELLYLDELSQFYYLNGDVLKVKLTLEEYLKKYSNEFSLNFMDIQKNIVLTRLGKVNLKLNSDNEAKDILKNLTVSQMVLNKFSKYYYPDFSLAALLLEKGYVTEVKDYINKLNANGILELKLSRKWLDEIEKNIKPEFEVDIFKSRYEEQTGTERYEIEKSQILLFKDSLKN